MQFHENHWDVVAAILVYLWVPLLNFDSLTYLSPPEVALSGRDADLIFSYGHEGGFYFCVF